MRNWLTVYADSMVIDEYSPLISNRPAINPGVYLSHLPKIPKLDLRVEGITDDMNVPSHFGPGAFYWDERYHSGYTNNGNLIFLCETGNLAVTPGRKNLKAPTANVKEPIWTHGLNLKVRKAGEKEFSDKTTIYGAEVFRDENLGATLYIAENGSLSAAAK